MLKKTLKRRASDSHITSNYNRLNKSLKRTSVLGDKTSKDEAEEVLEKIVLGDDGEALEHLGLGNVQSKQKDTFPEYWSDDSKTKKSCAEPKPVWEDDDDDELRIKISEKDFRHKYFKHKDKTEVSGEVYAQTLKSQFEKIIGQPSWAKLRWQKSDDEEDSDDDPETRQLLQSTGNYLAPSESLPKDILQIKSCPDANKEQPAKCKLRAMEFHPSACVMLTGGYNQTLSLFQIDGKHNPKIQSIFMEGYPVLSAHFSQDGTEVVVSSKHKSFKYYDMMAGQIVTIPKIKGLENDKIDRFEVSPDGKHLVFLGLYGHMHLISAKSKEWIASLKMNGSVEAVAFASDGSKMFSHGDGGEVYVWDMKTRDCVHKFTDDGCIQGTSLAVSKNGHYIATGSSSGVVNIYDEGCLMGKYPKPLRAVMNLTTACTSMVFNSTTEILALASNSAEKGVKMVHMPSLTVFSNFPDQSDVLRVPYRLDFSVNSGYFGIGNNKGRVLLYRLKHYNNY
ncbi:hypothetical protein LSH36_3g28021 [Paralvinella palmiformis]|uniref:U3 small nucleolar RNA-associated protein 18 homolog n=1 Tax=Paralvinella palmiformis TaxID=53620 RepID=A0AAD9NHN1_9ANNE|nr:hypothetical protein LSH36_3g28021 [Paralvinella palmiformis]